MRMEKQNGFITQQIFMIRRVRRTWKVKVNLKAIKKKPKNIIIFLIALLLLGAIIAGILLLGNAKKTWYDVEATEFTITTADELYDLAELSEIYDFKGQTIKLGADIVVNEGSAEDWGTTAPKRRWHPITGFAGTFDGQGHSISGIYGDGIVTSMGLFTDTKKSALICDFQLVNSYFKNGNDKGTGSIIGFGGGTLDSVYSDAIVEGSSQNFGGLIGKFTVKAENKITNCWFDGKLNVNGKEVMAIGGLVGAIEIQDAMNLIEHSLNTGEISSNGTRIGGICGSVAKSGFLRVDDSMSSGALTYGEEATAIGSVIGRVDSSSTAYFSDTYTVKEIKKETIGTAEGNMNGNPIAKKEELVTGYGGYQWTTLDFDNYWAVRTKDTPVLAQFAEENSSLAGITKKIDMSWYDANQNVFTITTAEQLYGFAYLSLSESFNGKTIKLGADIVINEGNAEDWAEKPPIYDWLPIGWHGTNTGQHFTGTFDGQGYSIKGVYVKGNEDDAWLGVFGEVYRKGTVKNLTITNSYFEGTKDSSKQGIVGSVAGRNLGTIDTVYSDAIVVGTGKFTGGIVGMMTGDGENLITNCWYDGELYGAINSGGIVGGIYGDNKNITATVEHCLNSGVLTISDGSSQVGGLCGVVQRGSTLNLIDSLNTGSITTSGTVKIIGSAIGLVANDSGGDSSSVANSVYGVEEFSKKIIGSTKGIMTGHCTNIATVTITGNGAYQWTTLDFANYWAIRKNDTPVLASFAESRPSVSGLAKMVDTSWYSADKKEFTITTVAQLYGFAQLSKVTDFSGKTIKLGADITINTGNASDWATKAPENVWIPIGYQGSEAHFSGTFDGQGHTISGIYVKGSEDEQYLGLFGEVYRGSIVKNVKLTNSYIEGTRAKSTQGCVGSIAGRLVDGTISGVYSDAIVVNSARMTGGIVGLITDDGNNKISNCWYDGEIYGYSNTGGIAGCVYGNDKKNTATIEHCLNTGTLNAKDGSQYFGGICGVVSKSGVLKVTDGLNTGSIVKEGKATRLGNVIGILEEGSTAQIDKVYGVKEYSASTVALSRGKLTESNVYVLGRKHYEGYNGYRYTQLDFNNYWVSQSADATPVLSKFAGSTALDMTGVTRADASWYSESGKTFTLTTASQFYGFTMLSKTNDFSGQTIQLGANITVNGGNATDWAENPPVKNEWLPIGYQGTESHFKGTFDGQGYSISGIYVKGAKDESFLGLFGEIYRGAVVKNLKITNSYVEGTRENNTQGCVGSVAGRMVAGTIENVYSDAIVVNSARMTGGLVGLITDDGNNKISNCWYAGELTGVNNSGGLVGCVYGNDKENTTAIEHSLNTSVLYMSDGTQHIGGIVGAVSKGGNLKLTDSLNTGSIVKDGKPSRIGTAAGLVEEGSSVTMSQVYGAEEFATSLVGRNSGTVAETDAEVFGMVSLKGYSGYRLTELDFVKYWAIQSVATTPVLSKFAGSGSLDMSVVVEADTSWYNENDKEFIITEASQLLGLAELSRTHDFEGQTIKLGNDIVLNNKTVDEMKTTPPANEWIPIGQYTEDAESGKEFKGRFDGQGYSICGLYTVTNEQQSLGLFGTVGAGGVVQNLTIAESYFANSYQTSKNATNYAYMGSVAGVLHGKVDTVKSEATLVNASQYTGGIVGAILETTDAGENDYTITNCWFDGDITASSNKDGGIVAGINGGFTATVSHCLNSGTINITASGKQQVGGLCGIVFSNTGLDMTDCLNVGTITYPEDVTDMNYTGSMIGLVQNDTEVKLKDVYGYTDEKIWFNKGVCLDKKAELVSGSIYAKKTLSELTDVQAYLNTDLSFSLSNEDTTTSRYWIVTDKTPILKSFKETTETQDLTTVTEPRTAWYSEETSKYTIYTKADLYGLAVLSADNDFDGKTVKLGADITVNENLYSRVENGDTTLESWTPIGLFKGTFNGQNHKISGIYASANGQCNLGLFEIVGKGGTVQNLTLAESYFVNTDTSSTGTYIGSVAGLLYGTLDTVKSEAKLNSASQYNGGLVGAMVASGEGGEYTVTNCWFAGTLTSSNQKNGGLVGGITGAGIEATISHCLNSGEIILTANKQQNGGICAVVLNGATLNLADTLNVGAIIRNGNNANPSNSGSVIGLVNSSTETVNVENVYGYASEEVWNNLLIYKNKGELNENGEFSVKSLSELKGENAKKLSLDFYDSTLNTSGYWIVKDANSTPVLCVFDGYRRAEATPLVADTEWYTGDAMEYTIGTAAELLGLSQLSRENDFAGITIKLGADIVLNNKTAKQMAAEAPLNVWEPIGQYKCDGTTEYEFKGTFDGQGHTISGIYVVNSSNKTYRTGLFGTVGVGGTVQDLKITKSYFKDASGGTQNNSAYLGSVTGALYGNINTIYSEATLESNSQFNGGLVGRILASETETGSENDYTIRNCWFAGTLTCEVQKNGGLVGSVSGVTAHIYQCLNSGTITVTGTTAAKRQQNGGICAVVHNGGTLDIKDTINVGVLAGYPNSGYSGSIVGLINSGTDQVVMENVYGYAIEDELWHGELVGKSNGTVTENGDCAVKSMADLTELTETDKKGLALGFSEVSGYWTLNNGQPVLYDFKNYLWTIVTESE